MVRIAVLMVSFVLVLTDRAVAHPAWALAIDTQRKIVYFSDLERVWKIDGDGKRTIFLADVHTHDLYLDGEGNLYGENHLLVPGTNTWRMPFWKATPGGKVSVLAERKAAKHFSRWDEAGNRYCFLNERGAATITRSTPEGETVVFAGGAFGYADGKGKEARFRLFGSSVWGKDKCLYFTSGGLVRKLALDGSVTTVVGPEQGFHHSVKRDGSPIASDLLGIDIDAEGALVFADLRQRKVFRCSTDGDLTTLVASGSNWLPSGVKWVGDLLYIVEYPSRPSRDGQPTTPRVRVLTKDKALVDHAAAMKSRPKSKSPRQCR